MVLGATALLGPGAVVFWLLAPLWFVVTGTVAGRRAPARTETVESA
jgi:hypothetical protein